MNSRSAAVALVAFAVAFCACMESDDPFVSGATSYLSPTSLPADAFINAIVPTSGHAGITSGSFAVTHDGAATYALPLFVPDGRMSMQPELSINYNSRGGDGLLGLGWGMSGFSLISRCGRTFFSDGESGGINFNDNDAFCLDGERLERVSATGSTPEFRKKKNGVERILRPGSSFEVHHPDGRVFYYGGAPTHTVTGEAYGPGETEVTIAWLLRRVEDTSGNFMTYVYGGSFRPGDAEGSVTGGGREVEYWPTEIRYTGHSTSGLGERSVKFLYEARPDTFVHFTSGLGMFIARRLKRIEMRVNGSQSARSLYV